MDMQVEGAHSDNGSDRCHPPVNERFELLILLLHASLPAQRAQLQCLSLLNLLIVRLVDHVGE